MLHPCGAHTSMVSCDYYDQLWLAVLGFGCQSQAASAHESHEALSSRGGSRSKRKVSLLWQPEAFWAALQPMTTPQSCLPLHVQLPAFWRITLPMPRRSQGDQRLTLRRTHVRCYSVTYTPSTSSFWLATCCPNSPSDPNHIHLGREVMAGVEEEAWPLFSLARNWTHWGEMSQHLLHSVLGRSDLWGPSICNLLSISSRSLL